MWKKIQIAVLIFALAFAGVLAFVLISEDFSVSVPVIEVPFFGDRDKAPNGQEDEVDAANDFGPVGGMNHQYLQGETFSRAIIEVDNADGANPRGAALDYLASQFRAYADKPGGVARGGDNTFSSPQQDAYTAADIANIARQNRANYSNGSTAVLHVIYLNGEFAGNENALAVAVNASTFAVFPEQINRASTVPIFASNYERAVLVHELGHLWGLVNINYQSEIAHEDAGHLNHSNNPDSVMYWAVESLSVSDIFAGGPPDEFDDADEADIENIKQGKY